MKNIYKLITLVVFTIFISACTLDVQDSFEFKPEIDDTDPFKGATAWSYIQQERSVGTPDDDGGIPLDRDRYDFMAAAIKHVGYENLYNQRGTTNRTYLLLNNNAFTGSNNRNDIMRLVTGSTVGAGGRINVQAEIAKITEPEQINMLKAILRYHIVTTSVAQVPTISVSEKHFLFETLLPIPVKDEDDVVTGLSDDLAPIAFIKTTDWLVSVNAPGEPKAPLPVDALASSDGNASVRVHNLVFNNGIGHSLSVPARFVPYESFTNFSVD